MKSPLFTGSATALITPFSDNRINYDRLRELIVQQINAGSSAIIICGTTGESSTLSDYEKRKLLEKSIEYANGKITIIAGTGSNNTSKAIEQSKSAQYAGADGLLIVTPYYNKANRDGLIRHYLNIADSVDIPIIVYNVPSRTGVKCNASIYAELSSHPNINGVKEASDDISLVAETLEICDNELTVWSGSDELTVPMMSVGAKGVISVVSNVIPFEMAQIANNCLEGRYSEASADFLKYYRLMKAMFLEVNPVPVKAAMNQMGMDVGKCRLPLGELSEASLNELRNILKTYNMI